MSVFCLLEIIVYSTKTSIWFRSLFIYQEEVKRAKRWMEWRLYQSQTNPRHAWQGEGLQCCRLHTPNVMFYGCIVWLAGFPRGSVHGADRIYQIYQAYTMHSQTSSFSQGNLVILFCSVQQRVWGSGVVGLHKHCLLLMVLCGLATSEGGQVLTDCSTIALWMEELGNLSSWVGLVVVCLQVHHLELIHSLQIPCHPSQNNQN